MPAHATADNPMPCCRSGDCTLRADDAGAEHCASTFSCLRKLVTLRRVFGSGGDMVCECAMTSRVVSPSGLCGRVESIPRMFCGMRERACVSVEMVMHGVGMILNCGWWCSGRWRRDYCCCLCVVVVLSDGQWCGQRDIVWFVRSFTCAWEKDRGIPMDGQFCRDIVLGQNRVFDGFHPPCRNVVILDNGDRWMRGEEGRGDGWRRWSGGEEEDNGGHVEVAQGQGDALGQGVPGEIMSIGRRQYGWQDRLQRETEMRQGTVRRYRGEETAGVVHRWREGNGSTVEALARDSDGTFAAEICTVGATTDIVDSGEWGGDKWVVKIHPHKPVQILNELCCVHQISGKGRWKSIRKTLSLLIHSFPFFSENKKKK
ncbi:hypothetical protein EDB85DRAFT_1895239 [Lactarius pseudohatsudake]|nr:hypothetical protein EDB85DRAFT_1895239 [Lactarius pseudohatsudake]